MDVEEGVVTKRLTKEGGPGTEEEIVSKMAFCWTRIYVVYTKDKNSCAMLLEVLPPGCDCVFLLIKSRAVYAIRGTFNSHVSAVWCSSGST